MIPTSSVDEISLETTFAYNSGADGNMFDVRALADDVYVTSFDISSYVFDQQGDVKVYTRAGSYVSHEGSADGWTLIYDKSDVQQQGRGVVTALGDFAEAVKIPGGSVQSFYVWTEKKVVYTKGNTVGDVFAKDDNLEFYEGIGLSHFFGSSYSPRVWNGSIHYHTAR